VSEDDNDERDVRGPRETLALFGHAEAEQTLLDSYKSGRIPHAWLIGGPPGIGKATLAYRLARFVLAHPDPKVPVVQKAASLAVDADNPVAHRIAAQAQGDLLVLERIVNETTGKLYTVIRVDDVRRTVSFFGSTAGEGGWRIAIVDAVDDLQREGANALLKVLEEPPQRTLLLLISHAPGRELPTIRSRCRRLLLRPLCRRCNACDCGVDRLHADEAEAQEAPSPPRQRGARWPCSSAGAGAASARARIVGAAAAARSARAACARRRAWRQRAADARGLHGHGQWLAVGAACSRRARPAAHGPRGAGLGQGQPRGPRGRDL
jgi:hypothetical protein